MLKLLNNDYKYIAIEGNIGVGKTTLAKFLSKEFNGSILLKNLLKINSLKSSINLEIILFKWKCSF